jgi:hypothetical protein
MSEILFFSVGGLFPVALIGAPILAGKAKAISPQNIILPLQALIDKPVFTVLFFVAAVSFFLANYKAITYIIDTFKIAPIPPKDFYNNILLITSVGASFCLIGFVILDFTHFTLLNTVFHTFFFILMNVFFILIDIANAWAYYTPSNGFWFVDLFLSFSSLIYLIFNQYALSSTETTIINTSAVFGYVLTPMIFIRYFTLFFEVKERIIQFVDESNSEEDEEEVDE